MGTQLQKNKFSILTISTEIDYNFISTEMDYIFKEVYYDKQC